jgi:rubrerythrin
MPSIDGKITPKGVENNTTTVAKNAQVDKEGSIFWWQCKYCGFEIKKPPYNTDCPECGYTR